MALGGLVITFVGFLIAAGSVGIMDGTTGRLALVLAGIAHPAHVAFGVHGDGAGEIFGQRKRRVAVKRRFEHAQQLALLAERCPAKSSVKFSRQRKLCA